MYWYSLIWRCWISKIRVRVIHEEANIDYGSVGMDRNKILKQCPGIHWYSKQDWKVNLRIAPQCSINKILLRYLRYECLQKLLYMTNTSKNIFKQQCKREQYMIQPFHRSSTSDKSKTDDLGNVLSPPLYWNKFYFKEKREGFFSSSIVEEKEHFHHLISEILFISSNFQS